MGATTLVALLMLLPGSAEGARWPAALCALTLLGFVLARQLLMPRINRARDAEAAGDAGAFRRFQSLHRLSVAINGVQWLAILAALWMVLL